MLVGVLTGICTFVFLSYQARSPDASRATYRFFQDWLFWPSLWLIFIPLPIANRLGDKVIEADKAYEFYRRDRESLLDVISLREMFWTKFAMMFRAWVTWGALAICFGCEICDLIFGR
jgi:hypothetical protein